MLLLRGRRGIQRPGSVQEVQGRILILATGPQEQVEHLNKGRGKSTAKMGRWACLRGRQGTPMSWRGLWLLQEDPAFA